MSHQLPIPMIFARPYWEGKNPTRGRVTKIKVCHTPTLEVGGLKFSLT